MKLRILSIFCVLALCLTLLPVTALADEPTGNWTDNLTEQPSGYTVDGSGNVTISSAEGLAWLAVLVNGLDGHSATDFSGKTVKLEANIDLSGHNWTPIGGSKYFKGTFDGGNHTISNLTIDTDTNYVGLFGATSGATLKNVTLDNPQVQNSAAETSNTGALVGYMVGNGTVEYCAVTNGSVSSDGQYVGGLIGNILGGTVEYCYNLETEVRSSYSTPTYVNGVAGRTGNYTYLCSSFSYVSNQKELKASNTAKYAAYLSETPTERTGTSGGQHGFTADQFQDGTVAYFLRTGFFSNVSYDGWRQTLGTDNLPKWNGEAVESLKYGRLGADGKAEDAYAYFNALTPDDGGTYHIKDTSDWIAFVKLVKEDNGYDADAVVEKDAVIDFSQFGTLTNKSTYSYLVIADKNSGFSYTGTFNGNGCTVTGVSYSGTMEFALFGTIGEDGSVSGITLEEPKISGTTAGAYNIAGIASHNYGTIDDCHVDGGAISTVTTTAAGIAAESFGTVKNCTNSADITAKYEVAGIVATSDSETGHATKDAPMVIEGCSNSGTITATNAGASYAGGIFGGKNMFSSSKYPYGTISKCFNTGNILGQSYIGGIVGYSIKNANASAANVTIENCYNTGAIGDDNTTGVAGGISAGTNSSVTNCFNMGDVTGTNAQPIVANGQGVQAWSVNSYASCEVNGPASGSYLYYGEDDGAYLGPKDEQGRYCRGSGKRTDAEMASGEVAYLLQQGQSDSEQVWSQQIGVDDHPVLVSDGKPVPVVQITVKLVDDGETATELTKCYTNKESTLSAYPEPNDPGAVYTFYEDANCQTEINTATKTYDGDTTIYAKVTELIKVTVSGIEVDEKTYDGLSVGYTGSVKATYGDTDVTEQVDFDYSWYSINGSSETLLTSAPADAGSYKLVVSVVSDTYTGQQEIKFEITQKEITAAVTGSVTKEYDGGTSVPAGHSLNIQFIGVIEADKNDVTADTSKISYTYKDANIGEGKTITASNVTLSGSRAFNYQLTSATATGNVGEITKAKINALTPPGNQTLEDYFSDAQAVIATLPKTMTGTTAKGNVDVDITWNCNGTYNSAPSTTNTFTWTATAPENYEFANDVTTSGEITVTNKAATAPSITATDKKVTYGGSTIDVSTMFTGVPDGSNPTYSIVTESGTTGTGTLSGTALTVTKAGTFKVKVTTEAVGNYAAGEATATLTVNKGSFTAAVTMGSYAQGGTPGEPSISDNKSDGKVTYYYNTTDTTGGGTEWTTDRGKTLAAGTYYMYAVIAETDLYNSCTTSATSFRVIDAAAGIVPPTAKTLTYTGKPQELVTAGSIEGGTMVYSLSEDGPYSEAIPTGINAGTYYVWYKAEDAAEASGKVSVQIKQAVIVSFDIPEDYYLKALYTKGEDVAALLRNEFDPVTGRTADGTEIEIKINGWSSPIFFNTRPDAVNEFGWWIYQSLTTDNYTLTDSLLDGNTFASGTIDVHNLPNVTITFDANGGSVQPTSATTVNYKLASLPTPTRSGYVFDGWFTQETDGEEVTTDTVFIAETTIYAQWSDVPTPVSPSYRVTVEDTVNGEAESSRSWASKDTTITLTVVPDDGYELASLTITKSNGDEVQFTDKGNGKFTFTMPGSNVTVEAIFKAITPGYDDCPQDETCPIWPFTDASTTVWYHDGVHFCIDEGLMEGYGGDLFGPNDTLSRAQLCQIVYNMEGQPDVTGDSVFTDVADGAWYADAVTWAAENGIVGGYGNGKFGPDAPITREQLAAILYRYAQSKGYDTTQGGMAIREYADFEQISDYAVEAMTWAVNTGLISGTSTTTLSPQGLATRAQVATILMRFIEGMA